MTTKIKRAPGRPRQFDPERAVEIAQSLFHSEGYDSVSVGDLTKAFGINPPSFYAAFGSKLGLYKLVLDRYTLKGALNIQALLRHDRPVAECLTDVLEEAARCYAADPEATGCLVLEGIHCDDHDAREVACSFHTAAEKMIYAYVAEHYPDEAARLTDYVGTIMSGLSARSRQGASAERLQETARMAGHGLAQFMPVCHV
ncbi:TetR family transcriptional regulator [Pantoea rodasii]|uniref:TetR family transcriptional regulator n=1 Tax=Pantoea rodasii TaxID=1076549 RepID=A0A2M9WJA6_9GAMM|nr:TetR/AcrR family transcriptional regulator [Pantoea rodasii]ORM61830.1 TetR family transcriptional regulator [Pantoea rodasii]PJZ07548.1 TetR family transcriptional regulator [Pantoea rodasii]